MTYSDEIVMEYKTYMHKRCGVLITNAQAQVELSSLVRLFSACAVAEPKQKAESLGQSAHGALDADSLSVRIPSADNKKY